MSNRICGKLTLDGKPCQNGPGCSLPHLPPIAAVTTERIPSVTGPQNFEAGESGEPGRVARFPLSPRRVAVLERTVTRLAKRAKRLGLPPPSMSVGPTRQMIAESGGWARNVQDVTVVCPVIRLPGGWEFLARIEPVTDINENRTGVSLVLTAPDSEEPVHARFREMGTECEHCNQNRQRNASFVVRSSDGEQKLVGSTCLVDYTGHKDAAAFAEHISSMETFTNTDWDDEEQTEKGGFGSSWVRTVPLEDTLAWISRIIAKDGWVSKKTGWQTNRLATADIASRCMNPVNERDRELRRVYEEVEYDADEIEAAIEWANGFTEAGSDYEQNLSAVATAGAHDFKRIGIAASLLPSYRRTVQQANDAATAATSTWVGAPKQKVELELRVTGISAHPGDWGTRWRVGFRDTAGNHLQWWATREPGMKKDETCTVRGTIKKHDEFNGTKITVLTRCVKAAEPESEPASE